MSNSPEPASNNSISRWPILFPVAGMIAFAGLYVAATFFYPGGSQEDQHSTGFSWMHNYWCNLLNEKALNGQSNPARPLAFLAMAVISISMSGF